MPGGLPQCWGRAKLLRPPHAALIDRGTMANVSQGCGCGTTRALKVGPAMARIVTSAYRYKRPPRRKKAVPLEVLAVMRVADPAKAYKHATTVRSRPQ